MSMLSWYPRAVRLSVGFLLLAFWTAPAALGQARLLSLEALAEASSDIVVASVTQKQSYWDEGRTRIYTEVRLQVSERVKGAAPAETVLQIPGGQVGNTLYDVSDMPVFIEGEEVLVFLWQAPSGQRTVTGAAQGKLRIERDAQGVRRLEPGAARLFDAAATVDTEADAAPTGRLPVDAFVRALKERSGN